MKGHKLTILMYFSGNLLINMYKKIAYKLKSDIFNDVLSLG